MKKFNEIDFDSRYMLYELFLEDIQLHSVVMFDELLIKINMSPLTWKTVLENEIQLSTPSLIKKVNLTNDRCFIWIDEFSTLINEMNVGNFEYNLPLHPSFLENDELSDKLNTKNVSKESVTVLNNYNLWFFIKILETHWMHIGDEYSKHLENIVFKYKGQEDIIHVGDITILPFYIEIIEACTLFNHLWTLKGMHASNVFVKECYTRFAAISRDDIEEQEYNLLYKFNPKKPKAKKDDSLFQWHEKNNLDFAYLFCTLDKQCILSFNNKLSSKLLKIFSDSEGNEFDNLLLNKYKSEFDKNQSYPTNADELDKIAKQLKAILISTNPK